jgi:hypothetical protein
MCDSVTGVCHADYDERLAVVTRRRHNATAPSRLAVVLELAVVMVTASGVRLINRSRYGEVRTSGCGDGSTGGDGDGDGDDSGRRVVR